MRTNFLRPPVSYSQKISADARPPRRPFDADTITFLLRTTIKRDHTTNRAAYIEINSVILHGIKSVEGKKMLDVSVLQTCSDSEPNSDIISYKIDLEKGSVSAFSRKEGSIPFSESIKNVLVGNLKWLIGERKGFKQIKPDPTEIHQESLTICFDERIPKQRKAQQIHRKVAEFIDWLRQVKH